ncbi:MAG: aminopeptidase P family protein [Ruminococcaceae bacterium]|nr:aminopeptidase P family protein [Oscillospiraceae bacterium]
MTRREKLVASFPENIDAIIVTNTKNQRYLTGFDYTDGYVIVTREKAACFTDFRYIEAAKKEVNKEYGVIMFAGKNTSSLICDFLSDNHVKNIGFESVSLAYDRLSSLQKLMPGFELIPVGNLIEKLRIFKDPEEVENIITAQRIAEKAFEHILGYISPDVTEIDVALELEFFMRKNGAEATSFSTIAVSGSASSMPHGVPRNVKLEKGFFTMDYGALYNGYCSDMTRTVVIGKADADIKKVYNTVLRAQTESLAAFRAGMTGGEADKVARDIIYGEGYEGCFGHSLGHGVGMDIHESPRVSGDDILKTGHVITCEPGIYIEGKYGCRIEDMVYLSENGPVNLTNCPKELIEL